MNKKESIFCIFLLKTKFLLSKALKRVFEKAKKSHCNNLLDPLFLAYYLRILLTRVLWTIKSQTFLHWPQKSICFINRLKTLQKLLKRVEITIFHACRQIGPLNEPSSGPWTTC